MKQLFFLLLLLQGITLLHAQKKLPAFGTVDKADLEMTTCAFEEEAPAMLLIDEGSLRFEGNNNSFFKMSKDIRVRIKILKSAGLNYADVVIPFRADDRYERVTEVQGATYNLGAGGTVEKTKLEKSQIFNQKVTDEYSEIRFSLPAVKVGSVIEYRYNITRESFSNIDPWIFQGRIPSRISRFSIGMPEYFRVTANLRASEQVDKDVEDYNERVYFGNGSVNMGVTRTTYTMTEVPGLKEEPFMSSYKDYQQRLDFQLSAIVTPSSETNFTTSWEKLAEELRNGPFFGEQLRKRVSIPELKTVLLPATTPLQKMRAIHQFCRTHFEWNGIRDFSAYNLKTIADQRKGSSGDMNLLLINLLRDADLDVTPLLVSTRSNGRVNVYYPFMRQFNNVLALVRIDGREYVLDATEKYTPSNTIPQSVMSTQGLQIYRDHATWMPIWNEKTMEKSRASMMAHITDKGVLEGEATVASFDYARVPRVKAYTEEKDGFVDRFLKPGGTDMKIEALKVTGLETDSLPFEQQFNFTQTLGSSGEYSYFSINLFNGLEKNPFLADTRVSDVDFGYNRMFIMTGQVSVAENFVFEELPKSIKMILPDTSVVFSRSFMQEDNTITFRYMLEFKRPLFYVQEYDEFHEFYKKLFELLNEQVVLRKKK